MCYDRFLSTLICHVYDKGCRSKIDDKRIVIANKSYSRREAPRYPARLSSNTRSYTSKLLADADNCTG